MNTLFLPPRELRRGEAGMTLVEVTIAVAVLGIGALVSLSVMGSTAQVDEEMRERATALRAALTRVETVMAYDYGDDIQDLIDYWTQPANASFTVEGLAPPAAGVVDLPNEAPAHGSIAVDATDPQRILVTVSVAWSGRRGQRSLALPITLTEIEP